MKLFEKILTITFLAANSLLVSGQADTVKTLDLHICINAALGFSPEIKNGFVQTEMKNAEISKAKSSQFPYLYSAASYNLTNQNKPDNNYSSASCGININQVVWQYGRNRALTEQSKFLYQAELSNFNALQQDIIVLIKLFYFENLKDIKLLELARQNVEQVNIFLSAAKEKKAIGTGKNSDILKAESDVANANYQLITCENLISKARNELMRLTGLSIAESTNFKDELFFIDNRYTNLIADSLFSIAKRNYPELKVIDDLESSQEAYIKSVQADIFPKISAGAGCNWNDDPLLKSAGLWNAGLTLSWDIFSGYRKKYQIKIEKLQNESYSYQRENLLLNVFKEIKNQYLSFTENFKQIGIIETLLKSTAENLNAVMEEYRQGISSMLELTTARTENFAAREKYINAWFGYQISKVQLERTLGITNK
jgi:outer membrane protein